MNDVNQDLFHLNLCDDEDLKKLGIISTTKYSCIQTVYTINKYIEPYTNIFKWECVNDITDFTPGFYIIYFGLNNTTDNDFDYNHVSMLHVSSNSVYVIDSYANVRKISIRLLNQKNIDPLSIREGIYWDKLVPEYIGYDVNISKVAWIYKHMNNPEIRLDMLRKQLSLAEFIF